MLVTSADGVAHARNVGWVVARLVSMAAHTNVPAVSACADVSAVV